MNKPAIYTRSENIGRIVMNDGKVNVKSIEMLSALHEAFDEAERDGVVVILTGEGANFSAGYNLKTFQSGNVEDIVKMLQLGYGLAHRILSFKTPVVTACNGNAYPAGAFQIMASDYRIAADGPFKVGMNEVTIGLPLPHYVVTLARERLAPAYLSRAAITGEMFGPQEGVTAGFFDKVVPANQLQEAATQAAEQLNKIDFTAHYATKLAVRKTAIEVLRHALDHEVTVENIMSSIS